MSSRTERWARRLSSLATALDGGLLRGAPPPTATGAPPPAGFGELAAERLRRTVDSVRNTITGLGGDYDKGSAARPNTYAEDLTYAELESLWRTNGYARRFVEKVPLDCTRNGWFVKDGSDDADPMSDEDERLDVMGRFAEAHTWARLYGGAWIMMVVDEEPAPGVDPSLTLQQPLDLSRVIRLRNLVVLERLEASVYTYDTDPRSPGFRGAKLYSVNPNAGGVTEFSRGGFVHASRMLYFPGAPLPPQRRYQNGGVDDSVIQAVWNNLSRKESHEQALAVLSQELQTAVLKMEDLAGVATSDQATYFDTRMKLLAKSKGVLGMVLLGQGEEYDQKPGTVSGMGELDNTLRQSLAAVMGMPQVVLYGDTPGGLNTDGASHRSLWQVVISGEQARRYTSNLRSLYRVVYAQKAGRWGGQVPPKLSIEYRSIEDLTPQGTAQLRAVQAQMDAAYVSSQVLDPNEVRAARFGERGWQDEYPALADRTVVTDPAEEAALRAQVAELRAGAEVDDAAPGAAPKGPGAGAPDAAVDAFAEKLTAAGVARCEHGSSNRCRICGIERVRDFEVGADGKPVMDEAGQPKWVIKWRPIYGVVAADPAAKQAGGGGATEEDEPQVAPMEPMADSRVDADDAVWFAASWPAAALDAWKRAREEAAVAVGFERWEAATEPHVTLLYVPRVDAARVPEVLRVADTLLTDYLAIECEGYGIDTFEPSPSSGGRWPVFVGLYSGGLRTLHGALSHACLTDEERASLTFAWYAPHCTLGYADRIDRTAMERLYGAREGRGTWVLPEIVMYRGGQEVKRWTLAPLPA